MAAVAEGSFQAAEEAPFPVDAEAVMAEAQPEEAEPMDERSLSPPMVDGLLTVAEEGEEVEYVYEDQDELRWSALAQTVPNAPAVEPGSMRLTGSFQGTATTSTHQLDLAVGLDVEMPSEVAAEAMRQLEARSRSASPEARRLTDGQAPFKRVEQPDESRTMWSTLADFFRRDAQEGLRRAQAAAAPRRALPDLQLKLEDVSTYKQEKHQLGLDLEASQGQVAQLEAQLLALEGERDDLQCQLDLLAQEHAQQVSHIDGLRKQGERCLSSNEELSSQLDEREAEIRRLESQLASASQAAEAAKASVSEDHTARERLEDALAVARESSEALTEENKLLKARVGELTECAASLQEEIHALERAGEAGVAGQAGGAGVAVATSPCPATPPREVEAEAEETASARSPPSSPAVKLRGLTDRVEALVAEREELKARLADAQADAGAAGALRARTDELEASVRELSRAAAEAEALRLEDPEKCQLREELRGLREGCATLQAERDRALQAAAKACAQQSVVQSQLDEAVSAASQAQLGGAAIEEREHVLRAELENLRRESTDLLTTEAAEFQRQKAAWQGDLEQARAEHAQARGDLAAALASKAAADAMASQAETSATTLQKEHNELLARASAREDKVRELSQQLQSAQAQLSGASARGEELAKELGVVRGQIMVAESAAAAESLTEIAELKRRHKDHEVQAAESLRDMEMRLQVETARREAAEREVAKTAAQNRYLEEEVRDLRGRAASRQEKLPTPEQLPTEDQRRATMRPTLPKPSAKRASYIYTTVRPLDFPGSPASSSADTSIGTWSWPATASDVASPVWTDGSVVSSPASSNGGTI